MEKLHNSLVDLNFIMNDTGFGKTFIYKQIKEGLLPKPKKIGRCSRWVYSDTQEFKKRLLSCSDG